MFCERSAIARIARPYSGSVIGLAGWCCCPLHATPDDQPPPLTAVRLLTEWSLDWWLVVGLAVPAVLTCSGWSGCGAGGTTGRSGAPWPSWAAGWAALLATMSGLGAYDTVLFSVHVVQHMILMMVTPMFLALGAPVTLALRTLSGGVRAACC